MLSIGFDDTDSPKGMCTTYLAYKIIDSLKKDKVKFVDYPRLIRFNPNIPWKTRGNGAVSITVKTDKPEKVKRKIIRFVSAFSDVKNGANPGVVFCETEKIPKAISEFSKNALWELISRKDAKRFLLKNRLESFHIGNGQGLVGAIGAIGYSFDDHTFELLSYRKKSQFGKRRKIEPQSVRSMQEKFLDTFNSFDTKKQKVILAPRGPDPVLYGVRGENAGVLLDASKMINAGERPQGHLIFKSNQGTGDHLQNELDVFSLKTYSSGTITGKVSGDPIMERGGHVTFSITKQGVEVVCYVYKPTGITKDAMQLMVGDKITVGGGIRKATRKHPRTMNVEFFRVRQLERRIILSNPVCEKCHKKMKSKGREQGFECVRCGKKELRKIASTAKRNLEKTIYIPDPSAHRHLTRPKQRLGRLNQESKFDEKVSWFCQYENQS